MTSQYGELRLTNGWQRLVSLGHLSKFQQVSRLDFVTASTTVNVGKPNFARCLAVFWASTLCIHFGGSSPLPEFCQAEIHFASTSCVLLYWQWVSPKLCGVVQGLELRNFRSWSFSTQDATCIPRAAITVDIGPHSSFLFLLYTSARARPASVNPFWRVFAPGSALWGSQWNSSPFMGQIPLNILGAWILETVFSSLTRKILKRAYYWNYRIDSDQILESDKDYEMPIELVQTLAQQIRGGGRPPSLKNKKIIISQQKFDRSPRILVRPWFHVKIKLL